MRRWIPFLLFLFACDDKAPVSDDSPATDADGDGVFAPEDCDDDNAATHPNASEICDGQDNDCDGSVDEDATDAGTWYTDGDGDGYGLGATVACEQPEGTSVEPGDCDDADPRFNPGAEESDCADPNDYNCDGSTGYADRDNDGVPACQDCDDGAAAVFPGAEERCDGADNDCDGVVDGADAVDASVWYADTDHDGHGDPDAVTVACEPPEEAVESADDCDDSRADVYPGAEERCDDRDNNCDGQVDEDVTSTWYTDGDSDGYGDPGSAVQACVQPSGSSADGTDCDDADGAINPGATELCDGVDNDCDNNVDEPDAADASLWYADGDADGYGDPNRSVAACARPANYRDNAEDCDDFAADVNPAATELCDSIDNDCDGDTDEDDAADASLWYADGDGDGYGDSANPLTACSQPSGAVSDDRDCDDGDAGQGPCASCLELLSGGHSVGDGVYTFDACGAGDADYYCDMTTDGGGWTIAGWQAANATTWLGTSDWGTVGGSAWSKDLACLQFDQIMVFNQTYPDYYVESYPTTSWTYTGSSNFAIGAVGTAFKQGTYGPASIVMGCVDYAYGSQLQTQWACDNDSYAGQKGHIADYAGEYCSGGRLDYTWAWTNGSTCSHRGVQYTWGFGVR